MLDIRIFGREAVGNIDGGPQKEVLVLFAVEMRVEDLRISAGQPPQYGPRASLGPFSDRLVEFDQRSLRIGQLLQDFFESSPMPAVCVGRIDPLAKVIEHPGYDAAYPHNPVERDP